MNNKRRLTRTFLFVILLLPYVGFSTTFAHAQAKIYVQVQASSNDMVGQRLVYLLRENIRKSNAMALELIAEDSAFQLRVNTLDPGSNGTQTVYAAVLTIRDFRSSGALNYYLTQWVGNCGSQRVQDCALNLVAGIENEITQLQEDLVRSFRNQK